MHEPAPKAAPAEAAEPIAVTCQDGVVLGAHLWRAGAATRAGTVIVNPATGVVARYYHYYARFLCEQGFDVLTYDYRGIGRSRPADLKGCGYRWFEWGELDIEAVLRFARARDPNGFLGVVGHSIGGFLPGFAPSAPAIDRMLTMGAQYAYWPDYAPRQRAGLVLKWHVAMPLLTALCGYFPGRRLGWLEDLPAGVANEWSFRRVRMELSYPVARRAEILVRFAAVKAPILAISMSDDMFGTPRAVRRALAYYTGSPSSVAELSPQTFGLDEIGHFNLFHSRHTAGFWQDTLEWLRYGRNPWQGRR
ncbi:alpha/beta hydrolase [Labrys miyagiensis]|uniref:Alpha/beta hydrolase n=1 Tax=Labrys miyagiensis TaxID=346912 RepID=A0ABQ6CTL4_9HYPH|nr:alpha/beta fold hydrolase [Labrys miyagiensis]GLS23100.1 alpha/beta hydrolase [Labrys miyagiensis]